MFEPGTGDSVAVTSQKPGSPFSSSTHLPLAVAAPSIAGVTAAQRSAPASAGKLEAPGPSVDCDVHPTVSAASATEASNLMLDPFLFWSGEPRPRDPPAVRVFDEFGGEHRALLAAVAAPALEAHHPLERGVAGERGLAFDAAGTARRRREPVVGEHQFDVMRGVFRDRAKPFAEIYRVRRGNVVAA